MRIALSATNPCHLWPMARALATRGGLAQYYSGYPRWRLQGAGDVPVQAHSWRTLVVYSLLKWVPERWRPRDRSLFLWQDRAFDRWVAQVLEPCDFIHAMPGQALHTFRRARRMSIRTVLNHATGPLRNLRSVLGAEYRRVGLEMEKVTPYDRAYADQIAEETALADFHCVASSIVREQLMADGVTPDRIWVVPYGADRTVFHRSSREPTGTGKKGFRIVYAGQLAVRKGIRFLLDALTLAGDEEWRLDAYGPLLGECERDVTGYKGKPALRLHGAVSQERLAEAFRGGGVLVLPSLEEGFGMVVVQALNCGMPCLVSDEVGARDLLEDDRLGAVFPARDAAALATMLCEWSAKPPTPTGFCLDWDEPANLLLEHSSTAKC